MLAIDEIKALFEKKAPISLDKIRTLLSSHRFTKEELADIACSFTDDCFCEYQDAQNPRYPDFVAENMCSNYIIDALKLLLDFGLDPNMIVHDDNVMWNAIWIDAPNIGAAVLRLLFENGGDPNHVIPSEQESLFDWLTDKLFHDEYTHDYFFTVQCWLVAMAYGAKSQRRNIPIKMLNGNSAEIFKNFELYDYTLEFLLRAPGEYEYWIMHIFNTETKEEVAILE